MSEIVADLPDPPSSLLFSGYGIEEYQSFGPDLFLPRARRARALRQGKLRQPARPAARRPQSQAARAGSCRPAAERAGAVGSARPQASSVAPPRRATVAAAARFHRVGEASRDRRVVVARGRGFRQVPPTVLAAVARGEIAPAEGARIARRVRARLRAEPARAAGAANHRG